MSQSRTGVDVSVHLPSGGRFSSIEIAATDETEIRPTPLSVVPALSKDGGITGAVNIHYANDAVWDFSSVKFTVEIPARWRPWFVPSALFILLSAYAVWLQTAKIAATTARRDNAVHAVLKAESLVRQLLSSESWIESSGEDAGHRKARLNDCARDLEAIRALQTSGSVGQLRFLEKQLLDIKGRLEHVAFVQWAVVDGKLKQEYKSAISELNNIANCLNRPANGSYWHLVIDKMDLATSVTILAIVYLISLLAILAKAQNASSVARAAVPAPPALYELQIAVTPGDLDSKANSVGMNLTFSPVTDQIAPPGPREIMISSGWQNGDLQVQDVSVLPAPAAISNAADRLRFSVPCSPAPELRRLRELDKFQITSAYESSIYAASQFRVQYNVAGAQSVHEGTGWSWLHSFPFDEVRVHLPLKFNGMAAISRIDVQRLSGEYTGDANVSGLDWTFRPVEDGRTHRAENVMRGDRSLIQPDQQLIVSAVFRRNAFQRYVLTVGVMLICVLLGLVSGKAMTSVEKTWQSFLIGTFGLFVLPFAIRSAVLAGDKRLPNLLTFQGTTIFEVIFVFDLLLMAVACWYMSQKRNTA